MRGLLDIYWSLARTAVLVQFQYRVANYFYMIGMIAEPVIYLVVWSSVAVAQGGMVGGYTPGTFAAYYIVWTLVRNMNIVITPYAWEWRIKQGELSAALLRPVHLLHADIAYFAGWKLVVILLWFPLAALLALIFRPTLNPSLLEIGVFAIAIWGAFLIRMLFLWLMGMVTFWTTRVSALYELYFAIELILSGRLVPLSLLPDWARNLAGWLPFQWTFGFPIEALVGQLPPERLLGGLMIQLLWIGLGLLLVQLVWRFGIRRYGAVGG